MWVSFFLCINNVRGESVSNRIFWYCRNRHGRVSVSQRLHFCLLQIQENASVLFTCLWGITMVSIALACSGQRYTVHHYQMHAIRIVMACNSLLRKIYGARVFCVLWSIFGFSCLWKHRERNAWLTVPSNQISGPWTSPCTEQNASAIKSCTTACSNGRWTNTNND